MKSDQKSHSIESTSRNSNNDNNKNNNIDGSEVTSYINIPIINTTVTTDVENTQLITDDLIMKDSSQLTMNMNNEVNRKTSPLDDEDCHTTSSKATLIDNPQQQNEATTDVIAQRKISHQKKLSSVGQALDSGKKMLEDSAKRVFKFCCFVIHTGKQLITYKDLPKWLQDNDFIKHFHRPQLKSFKLCFKSVFSLHTETGNIWTHIIGVLIMMILGFGIMLRPVISSDGHPHYPEGVKEYFFFAIFFICACTCMTFSWLFHTMSCHSEKVHIIFAKMDYTGISLLIAGSSIPVIYYGFFCYKKLFYIYLGIILGLCFTATLVSLMHVFATPKLRPFRASVFLTFGLSNIIPIIHIGVRYGLEYARDAIAVYYLVAMGSLYVAGALLYSFRVPERLFPGKITLVFQSHQIFHVLVVIAAVVYAFAICNMANYRVQHGRICPSKTTP